MIDEILTAFDLAVLTAQVRAKQGAYFKAPKGPDKQIFLVQSKQAESHLDKVLFRILHQKRAGELLNLAVQVAGMRAAQVEYFRDRTALAFAEALKLERSVDVTVHRMLKCIKETNEQIRMWNEKGER